MKKSIYPLILGIALAPGVLSCSDEPDAQEDKVKMQFVFNHPDGTKATETSFENGDEVGVFVCETGKRLEISGNVINNERIQFNGSTWNSRRHLYWDDGQFDVYAYYPYRSEINSINDMEFEISTDQRASSNGLSNYEASDLLFARSTGVVASSDPIRMQFKHIMSKVTIRLIKGEDYEGELPETADVTILNTVTKATLDLEAGVVTRDIYGKKNTVVAKQSSPTSYTAILVPQRIDNLVPLFEVTMKGVSYLYETRTVLKPGIHHIFNLVVDNNPEKVKIEVGGELNNWN